LLEGEDNKQRRGIASLMQNPFHVETIPLRCQKQMANKPRTDSRHVNEGKQMEHYYTIE